MATGYRRCRVCGGEYEYCRTNADTGVFRWQDVACSPEHGAIYFAKIAESRSGAAAQSEEKFDSESGRQSELLLDEDDFVEDPLDGDFDDTDEEIDIEL